MLSIIDPTIKSYFSLHANLFDQMMKLQGCVYRELENRRTQRIRLGEKNYFIKQHFGIGWKEIFKNLLQGKLPVISAKNEWLAIQRLKELNIATQTLVAYGYRGWNPATIHSFLITEELPPATSLEEICQSWKTSPPPFTLKRKIIKQIAHISLTLHANGINHRDFYLCHFLLNKDNKTLYLIDLHRAQLRKKTPLRWIIKDLSGLYFSSKEVGLNLRDYLRFIREYRNKSLREIFKMESTFWQKVKKRGDQLYRKHAN